MKRNISIMLISLYICFTSIANTEEEKEIENIEQLWIIEFARADVRETREKFIDTLMNLSPEQEKIFNPIFKDYETKFKKIGDERRDIILDLFFTKEPIIRSYVDDPPHFQHRDY